MHSDRGATATEYVLLVLGIAIVIAIAAFALGGAVRDRLTPVKDCVSNVTACPN